MRRTRGLLTLAASILVVSTRVAHAARPSPKPTLLQLADGYGIVAAEVVDATAGPLRAGRADAYDVALRVRAVYAQPTVGAALPAVAGDVIRVRLSVGYAGAVEDDVPAALAAGKRFVLTLRHVRGDEYEHAAGASAARGVVAFADEDRKRFARARELACVPPDERPATWVRVIADASESDATRADVLSVLSSFRDRPDPDASETATTAGLLKVWNDPQRSLSLTLLNQLDFTLRLRCGPAFDASADRARGWVVQLFDPTPANLGDDHDRDNLALFVVQDLLLKNPAIVGPAVVRTLSEARWPPTFRRALAGALLVADERADAPDASWEPALQSHLAGAFLSRQSWLIRLAANDLASGATLSPRARTFAPDATVFAAMRQASSDMATLAASDVQANVAAREIKQAIDALGRSATKPSAVTAEPVAR